MRPLFKVNLSQSVRGYLNSYLHDRLSEGQEKLPPETELAKSLGVSRVTLRRALDELERDGLVIRVQGKGTFANPEAAAIKTSLTPGEEFTRLIASSGYEPSMEVVSVTKAPCDERLKAELGLSVGERVYSIEKIYCADGRPAIVSIDRFSESLLAEPLDERELSDCSVFEFLRGRAGVVIERDKIEIESVNRDEAEMLARSARRLQNDSLLLFRGVNYDRDNKPVMVDIELYDTRFVRFSLMRVKDVP